MAFVYGRAILGAPTAFLDPIELKLSRGTYETAAMNGVFGALRDAGPDYWGRRVIERHAGKPQLNELDYLLYAGRSCRCAWLWLRADTSSAAAQI